MKFLVTGAGGFIGTHLSAYLSRQQYDLTCIVKNAKASDLSCSSTKVHELQLPSPEIYKIIAETQPDVLIHAAGMSSVPLSVENPLQDFAYGPPVVFQLLDALRIHSPDCAFILISSAAVYGNPTRLPISEDMALMPISPYGFHKLQSESLVKEFSTLYGVPGVSMRIFSAYGTGLKKQLLWDLCQKANRENEILVMGGGSETRDFIHVSDICRAIKLICKQDDFHGQAINICSGTSTPISDIALLLAAQFPHHPSIRFSGENIPGSPLQWQGDNSWLSSRGFECSVSLLKGIQEYVRWYKSVV
jgi:UDP-glucose 4-epimerase